MLWKIYLTGLEIILCKGEMGNATCDTFLDPKSIKIFLKPIHDTIVIWGEIYIYRLNIRQLSDINVKLPDSGSRKMLHSEIFKSKLLYLQLTLKWYRKIKCECVHKSLSTCCVWRREMERVRVQESRKA